MLVALQTPPEARILTSASFRRARLRAAQTCASPQAMRTLLDAVAAKKGLAPGATTGSERLPLDVICAVVEAHLEALDDAANGSIAGEPMSISITAKARLRLAVAALHFLTDPDDVAPGSVPHDAADDLLVLRWAARMAWSELPAT